MLVCSTDIGSWMWIPKCVYVWLWADLFWTQRSINANYILHMYVIEWTVILVLQLNCGSKETTIGIFEAESWVCRVRPSGDSPVGHGADVSSPRRVLQWLDTKFYHDVTTTSDWTLYLWGCLKEVYMLQISEKMKRHQ